MTMQTNTDTPEEARPANQETEVALDGATCSSLERLANLLEMPVDHVREAARNIAMARPDDEPDPMGDRIREVIPGYNPTRYGFNPTNAKHTH
jgi:hypothetical protein